MVTFHTAVVLEIIKQAIMKQRYFLEIIFAVAKQKCFTKLPIIVNLNVNTG